MATQKKGTPPEAETVSGTEAGPVQIGDETQPVPTKAQPELDRDAWRDVGTVSVGRPNVAVSVAGLDLSRLAETAPATFLDRLGQELHVVGLNEPGDFTPNRLADIQSALRAAIQFDALDILRIAGEQQKNA